MEDIEKLITIYNYITIAGGFSIGAVLGAGVLYYFIKSYFPAYISKKAEHLATKEDIGGITTEVEKVKAGYAKILEEVKASNQLKISAIERQQNLKTDVYMDAMEAMSKSLSTLATFANLKISEEKITSSSSELAGKIAKVQVVGDIETFKAVTTCIGEISTSTLHLMLERSTLIDRKNEIEMLEQLRDRNESEADRYYSIMKDFNIENSNKGTWDNIVENYHNEGEQRDALNKKINGLLDIQTREHLVYVKQCMAEFFEVSAFLPPAVLSIRSELGLNMSLEDYLLIHNQNLEKGQKVFDEFLSKLHANKPN